MLREDQDQRKEINKLFEPALPYKCNLWNIDNLKDINLDKLPNKPVNNSNFEDFFRILCNA